MVKIKLNFPNVSHFSNHLYSDMSSSSHHPYENIPDNSDDDITYENCENPKGSYGGLYENVDDRLPAGRSNPFLTADSAASGEERYYENLEADADNVYENYDFGENRIFQEVNFSRQLEDKDRGQRPEQALEEAGLQQFIRSIEEVIFKVYR